METVYKILYYGQKIKNTRLRDRLDRQKEQTEAHKRREKLYYNSYMSECDELHDLRSAFIFSTCDNCLEEIVLASRSDKLNYCPKCGAMLFNMARIAERRC